MNLPAGGKCDSNGEGHGNEGVLELSLSGLGRDDLVGGDRMAPEKVLREKRNLTFAEWRWRAEVAGREFCLT